MVKVEFKVAEGIVALAARPRVKVEEDVAEFHEGGGRRRAAEAGQTVGVASDDADGGDREVGGTELYICLYPSS